MAEEFVSETIVPDPGTADTAAMARGLAGLPAGFTWRGRHYAIVEILREWKVSEAEKHRGGELYYRKHFWKVRADNGDVFTLYAVRQTKLGEKPKQRWWLYTMEKPESPG